MVLKTQSLNFGNDKNLNRLKRKKKVAGKSFLVTGGNKCLSTALATITSRLNRVKGPVQERECCLGHPETGTSCTSHCSQGVN